MLDTTTLRRSTPGALANIDKDAFARLWARHHISTETIAVSLGVSRQAVSQLAARLDLPPRVGNRAPQKKSSDDLFRRMWLAGVPIAEIAQHFGYAHRSCVSTRRRKIGLPARVKGPSGCRNGGWVKGMSLTEFLEEEMARAMETRKEAGR